MAATKYQLLGRYFNSRTNSPITNSASNEYENQLGLYTKDGDEPATEKIMQSNDVNDPRNDMIFAYAGTKKIYPTDMGSGLYVEKTKTPYIIIDTYRRVQFSPWIVLHTCGSLESAIEKATIVVKAIGLNNVKLIKLVSLDQFIQVK